MSKREIINSSNAPAAIGTYSQAVRVADTVYMSGQIPLDPVTGEVVDGDFQTQATRVFDNLKAVAIAAGGDMDQIARITIYMTDLANFPIVNQVMARYFDEPYPARAAIGVASLPKAVAIEIDGIMVLDND